MKTRFRIGRWSGAACVLALAGCAAAPQGPSPGLEAWPSIAPLAWLRLPDSLRLGSAPADVSRYPSAAEGRDFVSRLLPSGVSDRMGWSTDIFAAFATLDLPPSAENLCAAVAVIEQESGFRVDPPIPGLPRIAWKEIERRRAQLGVPRWVLDAALELASPNGRTFKSRLDRVRTERELDLIFDDFIGQVPLGRTFLADRNPVRTAGPMQVSVAFAESHAAARRYPYPVPGTMRDEVFTRHGGVYFGVAHLLDYPAAYHAPIYRFADFNAGRYASRNAAFQKALTQVTGLELAPDGDLLRFAPGKPEGEPGATALAATSAGRRLRMDSSAILRDLRLGTGPGFEQTTLYRRVFELADARSEEALPRAVLPRIALKSPKITRSLSTEWFARRVDDRHRRCLARAAVVSNAP